MIDSNIVKYFNSHLIPPPQFFDDTSRQKVVDSQRVEKLLTFQTVKLFHFSERSDSYDLPNARHNSNFAEFAQFFFSQVGVISSLIWFFF